jgi:hypothetical protein
MMKTSVKPLSVFLAEYSAKVTAGHTPVVYPSKKEYKIWNEAQLKLWKVELK